MKYSLLDIFQLYLKGDYSKTFYHIEENYSFNIHGNFYKRVLSINDNGVYCKVYDKMGSLITYHYIRLDQLKNLKNIWSIVL